LSYSAERCLWLQNHFFPSTFSESLVSCHCRYAKLWLILFLHLHLFFHALKKIKCFFSCRIILLWQPFNAKCPKVADPCGEFAYEWSFKERNQVEELHQERSLHTQTRKCSFVFIFPFHFMYIFEPFHYWNRIQIVEYSSVHLHTVCWLVPTLSSSRISRNFETKCMWNFITTNFWCNNFINKILYGWINAFFDSNVDYLHVGYTSGFGGTHRDLRVHTGIWGYTPGFEGTHQEKKTFGVHTGTGYTLGKKGTSWVFSYFNK